MEVLFVGGRFVIYVTLRKQQRLGTAKEGQSTTKPKLPTQNSHFRRPAPLPDDTLIANARLQCTTEPQM